MGLYRRPHLQPRITLGRNNLRAPAPCLGQQVPSVDKQCYMAKAN